MIRNEESEVWPAQRQEKQALGQVRKDPDCQAKELVTALGGNWKSPNPFRRLTW